MSTSEPTPMQVTVDNEQVPDKPEPKLTRQQKRMVERANEEANTMHRRLVNQFCEYFIDNEPHSDEVIEKQREVNAKWRVYCKNRHLTPEVLGLVDQACNEFREQFNNELNGTDTLPQGSAPVIP